MLINSGCGYPTNIIMPWKLILRTTICRVEALTYLSGQDQMDEFDRKKYISPLCYVRGAIPEENHSDQYKDHCTLRIFWNKDRIVPSVVLGGFPYYNLAAESRQQIVMQ